MLSFLPPSPNVGTSFLPPQQSPGRPVGWNRYRAGRYFTLEESRYSASRNPVLVRIPVLPDMTGEAGGGIEYSEVSLLIHADSVCGGQWAGCVHRPTG